MSIHVLQRTQRVTATLEECWRFFSDPRNLARITPPSLDFQILSDLPARMHPGLMIRYRVRPLLGVPMSWLTEITHIDEPHYFVDEQRVGPYSVWHHEHRFTELPGGQVELEDRVHYVLPFGPLGALVNRLVVQRELERIFAFRRKAVEQLFAGAAVSAPLPG